MRSQRPFQFDVLRSLSCLAHTKHLPPSHPPLSSCSVCLLFSPRSLRFAFVSPRRCNPSVSLVRISYQLGSFSRSLALVLRVPFAKLRSIFHLEPRRSLAINPRILLRPTGNPIASSSRHPHVGLPGCLLACSLACLPVPVIGFAPPDHLDDPDASSFGYATSFPVIGPTRVFASTAVIRSRVAVHSVRITRVRFFTV